MKNKNSPDFICYNVAAGCIAKCDFCIADFPKTELNTYNAKKVIKQIAETNVKMISFSGREPFLRNDIFTLLKYAKSFNLPTIVETTGAFLTQNNFEKLKICKLNWLSITIDSLNKAKCKEMGRYYLSKSHYKTIWKECKKNNIKLKVNTIVNKITLSSLDEIGTFFLNFPPTVWKLRQFIPRGLGRKVKTKYEIPKKSYIEKIEDTEKKFPSLKIKYSNIDSYDNSLIIISPNGDIHKVIGEDYINYGNICDGVKIIDIWNKKFIDDSKKQSNKHNFEYTYN
jgi:MoaA/NifB/PqqE/SkfB family radical SAM enzyme